jgi:lipoate-protein ligase A
MFCINLQSNDPFFNLAIEEYLLKNTKAEFLILYINTPSVIIGKHQTGHREVNTRFVTENNIPVIRRISGGGTVYHDNGNLNFSFIRECEAGRQVDFPKYTQPVIGFLKSMGVDARFEGKNDLKVGGLKISGNAEHIHRNRVLHHGTLLFSASFDILSNSIRHDTSSYSSRAVASNPSKVTNLNQLISDYDIEEFRAEMIRYFTTTFNDIVSIELTEEETTEAISISLSKYQTWEWNWAYGPEYIYKNSFIHKNSGHQCRLFVKDGLIRECNIDGSSQLKNLAEKLIGCRHMTEDLSDLFRKENVDIDVFNFF